MQVGDLDLVGVPPGEHRLGQAVEDALDAHAVEGGDDVPLLDARRRGRGPLVHLHHRGGERVGALEHVDRHGEEKRGQDVGDDAGEQDEGAGDKALARVGARKLELEELVGCLLGEEGLAGSRAARQREVVPAVARGEAQGVAARRAPLQLVLPRPLDAAQRLQLHEQPDGVIVVAAKHAPELVDRDRAAHANQCQGERHALVVLEAHAADARVAAQQGQRDAVAHAQAAVLEREPRAEGQPPGRSRSRACPRSAPRRHAPARG